MRTLMLFAYLLATTATAGELLKDPDKASSWKLLVDDAAAVKMTEADGAFRFDVTRIAKEKWRAQVMQTLTGLRSGTPYTLRFSAKASTAREFEIRCQHQGGSWGGATGWIPPVKLTTQWQPFTVPIVFEQVDEKEQIRAPIFVLGSATGTYWVKEISLRDDASPAQPAPTQSPANLLRNPLEPTAWTLTQSSGAKASLSKSGEDLKLVVEKAGTEDWHVEMFELTTDLKTPGTYTLDVAMRADSPRRIPFTVQGSTYPFTKLVPVTDINIDTQLKRYRVRFKIENTPSGELRAPVFLFGGSTGTVWLRPISLTGPANAGK